MCRYKEAVETFEEADEYFNKLSCAVSHDDIQTWSREIIDAENQRLQTPAAMDIMSTRKVAAEKDSDTSTTPGQISPGIEWIRRALGLEERQ